MAKHNRQFGEWGERLAEDFLKSAGFEMLGRNFRKRCGEIDLICRKGGALHFVEVKTRTPESVARFGLPQEAVTKTKQRKLIETALTYLAENGSDGNTAWQIDVISVVRRDRGAEPQIDFIENAFGEM